MSTTPLVLQLQELASNNKTDVTELLRKSLLVASKLNLQPLREWANHELSGYPNSEVPEYRHVRADLRARNPYHGLIPFLVDDNSLMERICNVPVMSPVGSLVDLLEGANDKDSILSIPFAPEQKMALMRMQGTYAQLEPVRTVGRNQVAAIIDVIRTTILDWSLKLEADGVLGEGFAFSAQERERAQASITIENFQGILGNVSGSTVTQNLRLVVRKGDLKSLRKYLVNQGIEQKELDDLEAAIEADPTPVSRTFGKRVSDWIGKMVSNAATGAWDVGINAAGGVVGDAIGTYYGF